MGHASQAFGKSFEDIFELGCRRVVGMAVTRFPSGCKTIGRNQVIRVKTPCDYILTYGGVTALIDTKTVATGSFSNSLIVKHQVVKMLEHEVQGAKAGYVIWFRETDDVVFFSSSFLCGYLGRRGSINSGIKDAKYLGKAGSFNIKMIFGMN